MTLGGARERMVAGAADMMARRGLNATSMRDLARHTGTPFGSTYHHFPGGKSQLAAEAVHWADQQTAAALRDALDGGAADGVRALTALWRATLVDGEFARGCPVLAVAVEQLTGADDGGVRDATVFAFSRWIGMLSGALRADGRTHADAAGLATLIIAAIEGAVAMCRAERSAQPLDAVEDQLLQLLAVRP